MDSEALQSLLQDELSKAGSPDSGGLLAGFSLWTLFFGFAFSVFGWWIFKEGKKKQNYGLIGIGIGMMIYPYFVYNPWAVFLVGAGLSFAAYKIWNR
jgi:hypothetical protein